MPKHSAKCFLFVFICIHAVCAAAEKSDSFYEGFVNPPAQARPFVRWWWIGNCVNETEILRELDVLKQAGFGGVEINPIGIKGLDAIAGDPGLVWLSPAWNRMLETACRGARERGMIADLIVGAGWPFGGQFLKPDQRAKRLVLQCHTIQNAEDLQKQIDALFETYGYAYSRQGSEARIQFIKLLPDPVSDIQQVVDLQGFITKDPTVTYPLTPGRYILACGILQRGYMNVANGAPGADGPIMDHYKKEVMSAYLKRLEKIESDTGVGLNELVRALFCDSIELKESNWSDDFAEEFKARCGYDIEPWLPLILFGGPAENPVSITDAAFKDQTERVRYDYSRTLAAVFHERFTHVFQKFCTDKGVLCRYQAYGHPWLMGMAEGYMIPDIPEGNTWLFAEGTAPYGRDAYGWSKTHGFMIWNKYAAAGGHLTNRRIISCEAATNVDALFQASLSILKQSGDMNFIAGINHSILHGFNYSPPEAGFPGLIKFGTYFSEQNTWWPYVKHWLDYDARLSYVFQNSTPVIDVAVLGPTADIQARHGLKREPFHLTPWYLYEMWQTLCQNGSSCDYISESVLQKASFEGGRLTYGPMAYKALVAVDVERIQPATVLAMKRYVENGGKVIFVGQTPKRSCSLANAEHNDRIVADTIRQIGENQKHVFFAAAPVKDGDLTTWTKRLLDSAGITPYVEIDAPDPGLYQICHKKGDRDILFFVNSHRLKTLDFTIRPKGGFRKIWRWDPETGSKSLYASGQGKTGISLGPLESLLLVSEPVSEAAEFCVKNNNVRRHVLTINGPWEIAFHHVNGTSFKDVFSALVDFRDSSDDFIRSFAGRAIYTASFEIDTAEYNRLDLGNVNECFTEVTLNGKNIGTRWYGNHIYDIKDRLTPGKNTLTIHYTTLLANYLSKDITLPCGIAGPISIFNSCD